MSAQNCIVHCISTLSKQYKFDDSRIWNLDETGTSAGKGDRGTEREKRFMARQERNEFVTALFAYQTRVTIMPVLSAAG